VRIKTIAPLVLGLLCGGFSLAMPLVIAILSALSTHGHTNCLGMRTIRVAA
jgi:hypothetical protein